MRRREFFKLASGLIVPLAWQRERAYSFLWAQPANAIERPATWVQFVDAAGRVLASGPISPNPASRGIVNFSIPEALNVVHTGTIVAARIVFSGGEANGHVHLSGGPDVNAGQSVTVASLTLRRL